MANSDNVVAYDPDKVILEGWDDQQYDMLCAVRESSHLYRTAEAFERFKGECAILTCQALGFDSQISEIKRLSDQIAAVFTSIESEKKTRKERSRHLLLGMQGEK